jgi:hypothetical protein
MKVPPFYSLMRGLALEDLWHNNNECEIGLSIKLADRLPGKDRVHKHCPYCQVLNQPRPLVTTW